MKQVKSIEISSFELFAPHYLQHVTKALEEKVCVCVCVMLPKRITNTLKPPV